MLVEERQKIEREIVTAVVKSALENFYSVAVYDGETETKPSNDVEQVLAGMFATDEELLVIYDHKSQAGWVSFVYGNDGYDVIHDYSLKIDHILVEAQKIADRYS